MYLKLCCVATSGQIVAFQEGIIDMSGPGADFNSFSKMNILVPLITPVPDLHKHVHEATVRIAGLKTTAYMAKQTLNLEPDETETFEHESILEMGVKYPNLPKSCLCGYGSVPGVDARYLCLWIKCKRHSFDHD
ncbi:MAG: glycine/sarcosine/betaine reductase component B subunit [Dorea sp.]